MTNDINKGVLMYRATKLGAVVIILAFVVQGFSLNTFATEEVKSATSEEVTRSKIKKQEETTVEQPRQSVNSESLKTEMTMAKENLAKEETFPVTPLPFRDLWLDTQADHLAVEIAYLNSKDTVDEMFNNKMWRKRYVPFYFTFTNSGHYPIEVSTGNILLLDESLDKKAIKSALAEFSATKTSSVKTKKKKRKKKKGNITWFTPPIPPGVVFEKAKHVQYGWKGNLGMVLITGATLGLAAPITLPALVVGNAYRGSNKRMAFNFQDQSLERITIEPGETVETWLFYQRDKLHRSIPPKKIVFADIYTPERKEFSQFVIDYQPLKINDEAIRRELDVVEVAALKVALGKVSSGDAHLLDDEAEDKIESLLEEGTLGEPLSDPLEGNSIPEEEKE